MLTEYHAYEMLTARERTLWNALKFRTTREVYSKQGVASVEWLIVAPINRSEVGTPQGELNGAVGEVLLPKPRPQTPQTKLILDVGFDDPFLD